MSTYTNPTGAAGTMRIDDNGTDTIDFWLLGVNELVEQVPWSALVNGADTGLKSFRLEPNVSWQKVASFYVAINQEVTFHLGASGNVLLGGPTDFSVDVQRAAYTSGGTGTARINVNGVYFTAIPYVKDGGEWKQAEPWGKIAGEWRPAP